ncbi:hypothetical protein L332_12945 [Agrococcus pavilionensis RW1]|uniref:Uncharacterized protein n=1 Tax=Agrococcus pavilionensis RW1 TaxID=1330458 RepID=U1LS38_9MICO|nr:hypothetical protein L332_12945 [Agrococcus pavilionensis RW1]
MFAVQARRSMSPQLFGPGSSMVLWLQIGEVNLE